MKWKIASVSCALVFSAVHLISVLAQNPPAPIWAEKMLELSKVVSELLPDIASQAHFKDKDNAARIQKNMDRLSQLSTGVHKSSVPAGLTHAQAPDLDPSIHFLSALFASEVKRAQSQFRAGNHEYARSVLKSVTGFCIACHTRGNNGPQFPAMDWASNPSGLTPFERAELFAATRQFDRSFEDYMQIISGTDYVTTRQIEWERSIRHALSISVRVKDDPALALKVVDRVLLLPGTPAFVKVDAQVWKGSIDAWKKELPRKVSTPEGIWAEAKRLMNKASTVQKYPTDRSADIWYLRGTRRVHDYLRVATEPAQIAQALYLAGVAYEAMGDMRLWSLSDIYFEACIRRLPHSETARQCYGRYEQSVFAGYSGSGGISLPDDIKQTLNELREISEIVKSQK